MPLLTIVYSRRFISYSNLAHTPESHRGVSYGKLHEIIHQCGRLFYKQKGPTLGEALFKY